MYLGMIKEVKIQLDRDPGYILYLKDLYRRRYKAEYVRCNLIGI